jgi:hypothetical protein
MRSEIHKRFMELGLVDKPTEPEGVKLTNIGSLVTHGMPLIFTDEGRNVGWVKQMSSNHLKDLSVSIMAPQRQHIVGQEMITECVFNISLKEVQELFGKYLYIYKGSSTSTAPINKWCIGMLKKMESNINGSNNQLLITGTIERRCDIEISEDLIGTDRDISNDHVMVSGDMIVADNVQNTLQEFSDFHNIGTQEINPITDKPYNGGTCSEQSDCWSFECYRNSYIFC